MIRSATTLSLILLAACATTSNIDIPPGEHVGEPIQTADIQKLAHVQAAPEDHFEQTLLVEAKIVAVCQTKGCWMQVEDGDQTAMVRWETGCGGKYAFPKDAAGEMVLIQGSYYPKELDAAAVEHLKAEAGKELDLPEKGYEFNASAVILVDRKN